MQINEAYERVDFYYREAKTLIKKLKKEKIRREVRGFTDHYDETIVTEGELLTVGQGTAFEELLKAHGYHVIGWVIEKEKEKGLKVQLTRKGDIFVLRLVQKVRIEKVLYRFKYPYSMTREQAINYTIKLIEESGFNEIKVAEVLKRYITKKKGKNGVINDLPVKYHNVIVRASSLAGIPASRVPLYITGYL